MPVLMEVASEEVVTATTDFVITNVIVIEQQDDVIDFKNGKIRMENFKARAKKVMGITKPMEKLDFLSYRKGSLIRTSSLKSGHFTPNQCTTICCVYRN